MWLVPDGKSVEPNLKIIVGWDGGRPVVADDALVNTRIERFDDKWSAFTDRTAALGYVEAREAGDF